MGNVVFFFNFTFNFLTFTDEKFMIKPSAMPCINHKLEILRVKIFMTVLYYTLQYVPVRLFDILYFYVLIIAIAVA